MPALTVALALVFGVTSARSFANGRFPESQRLLEHPGNPDRLYLAATFGLLVTEDRGKNWYSLCEEAFALKLLEGDPALEVMSDGSLLAGIYESINRSSDCGCTWNATLGASEAETVWDIAIDRKTGAVVALMNDATTSPGRWSVHESTDLGKTWHKLSDLPVEIVNAFTLDVAPSDSSRIYVSGITTASPGTAPPGLLLVSTDHGATWEKRIITGAGIDAYPYIAGVDPTRPDRIYVRTDDWSGTNEALANDALLYTDDAGKTWRELARRGAKLFGFALSPDGATVLIGYGDPVDAGGRTTNADDFGIYKASTAALAFERIHPGAISCLRWTATGVYACVTEDHPDVPTPGMGVGFAPNAEFTLATANPLTSLLSMKNVRGPLACVAAACIDNWKTGVGDIAALCQAIRATCDIDPTKNVLACVATGTGGAGGGSGGASGGTGGASGATGGAGVDASADRDGTTGGTGGGGGGGGCSCRTSTSGPDRGGGAFTLLVVLVMLAPGRKLRRRDDHCRSDENAP